MAVAWQGAVEFGGFPIALRFEHRVKSTEGPSFKMVSPDGNGVKQAWKDAGTGKVLDERPEGRAVEHDGRLVPLSPNALEQIKAAEKTRLAKIEAVVAAITLPLDLSSKSYEVIPDPKAPGSDQAANILWNGLRESGLALVFQMTMRSGSMDKIVALTANDEGMFAFELPFAQELHVRPSVPYTEDAQAAQVFSTFIETQFEPSSFNHSMFVSEALVKREKAVEAALSADGIEATEEKEPQPVGGGSDLMDLMVKSIEAGKQTKKAKTAAKKASKNGRKKVTA